MGSQILGLNLGGHHKLLEYFWTNMIPKLKNIRQVKSLSKTLSKTHFQNAHFQYLKLNFELYRVLVMGTAEDCCSKVLAKIHIDQFIDCIAQNCPRLSRLEIRWDDETLRFSDKSRSALLSIPPNSSLPPEITPSFCCFTLKRQYQLASASLLMFFG